VGASWLTVLVPKPSQSSPSAPSDPNADVAALGYEAARDELVAVVARLEAGAATLEESLTLWERGEALAARCQQWLDGARERLSAVRDASSGTANPDDEES
jgi:exodeoxyribonuclease VII small subunit